MHPRMPRKTQSRAPTRSNRCCLSSVLPCLDPHFSFCDELMVALICSSIRSSVYDRLDMIAKAANIQTPNIARISPQVTGAPLLRLEATNIRSSIAKTADPTRITICPSIIHLYSHPTSFSYQVNITPTDCLCMGQC